MSRDAEFIAIVERVNESIHVLNNGFIDEFTFNNRLEEFSKLQNKALSVIEKLRKENETLKSNIK